MNKLKIYLFLFTVLIFGNTNLIAQLPAAPANLVTKNLVKSLNHEVEGVVESSIYNTIFLEQYYPDADINKVLDELNRLSVESENPTIRYKSQLAFLYLTNYQTGQLKLENYKKDESKLFRDISEILKSSLLVSK